MRTRIVERLSGGLAVVLLRLVVFVGPVLALLATGLPGPAPRGWLVALTIVLALGFAWIPESALGTSVICLVVVWWTLALNGMSDALPVEAVGASVLLVAAHLAALLLSYGPAGLPLDGTVLRRWLRRGLPLAATAPLVWLVAVAVDGQPEPPGIWAAALAAAVVVCVVAAKAVTTAEPSPEPAGEQS